MQKIALLIATKNEEVNIEQRLANIADCIMPEGFLVDILVLDNGSTDGTIRKVEQFETQSALSIKPISLPSIGKCGALFWAFKNTAADYFLMTDANTVFNRTVLVDFDSAIKSAQPKAIVWVGNGLGFPYGTDVSGLDSDYLGTLQERHRIESKFGTFTGANGACYGLSARLVDKIWELPSTRNDDFIISIYAASRGEVVYAKNSYAYEFYSNKVMHLFKNKFRDSIGHTNALIWILKYVKPFTCASKVVISRLLFWLSPVVLAILVLYFSKTLFFVLTLIAAFTKRSLFIKYIALIWGLLFGLFVKAPVAWLPNRNP